MKKVFKIFSIIIGALIAVIIMLSVLAKVKEKEIADIALRKVSKSIKAPIMIGDISLSLLRRFPLATIEFKDIWLGSPDALGLSDSLISDDETLAKIEKVYVSVKTRPLFKGKFEIMKVEIKGVDVSYIVDSRGISNFDFLIDTTQKEVDTTSISLSVILKELTLSDIHCNYYDSLNLLSAQLVIPKVKINGKIIGDYFGGSAKGELKLTNCNYKATPLNLMREATIDFELAYSEDTVNVKELIVSIDGAELAILGSVVLKDTIETNLSVEGTKLDVAELIKYVPKQTLKDYGLKEADGIINFKASIQGSVADSVLPEVKMEVEMKDGRIQYAGYPELKNISFAGNLTNGKLRNNQTTSVSIRKFHAETRQSIVDMSFSLNNLDRIRYKINSDIKIDLGEFKEYIPDTIIRDVKGHIFARLATKGILPDSVGNGFIDYLLETSQLELTLNNLFIAIDSTLSLNSLSGYLAYDLNHLTARDLNVNIPSYKVNINNASFDAKVSGKISKLSSFGIDLKSYQIRTDSCTIYGTVKIQDLEAPEFNITSSLKLNLGEVKTFLPDTLVNNLSGEIIAQISSYGKLNLDSISSQVNDLIFKNSSFRINFDRVSADMPDTLMSIKEFSGELSMKSDTIEINNTRGVYSGIDFSIDSTKVANLYNSVIKNQASQLYIEGRFDLGNLNYTMFAPFIAGNADTVTTSAETKDTGSTVTNYTYLIKGKLGIRSVTYKKAVAENISALFNLTDSLYLVDQFKFNAFDGIHNTSVKYSIKKDKKTLWVKNSVDGMDVNKLLRDFDNFKEYYEPAITYENVTGILSSNFDSQILFIGDSLVRDKLYVRCSVKLQKGGIYNYQPVIDMEQYLKGVGGLNKLEFKTINSSIFVFQDAIYVPNTLIVSNKLDASAFGMKTFGEDYEYHIEAFLSDILTGKSKKLIEKQDEKGDEVTAAGRKGTLLKSYSINGKIRSGLDNKDDRAKMQNKIKASEKLLNVRFNPYIVKYNTGVY